MDYSVIIDGTRFEISDPVVTGRQLLELANRVPVEEYLIFYLPETRQLEDIDLEETLDLRQAGAELFLTFKSDRTFNLVLNGQRQPWGSNEISEQNLRKIGRIDANYSLWLVRQNEPDQELEQGQIVPLDSKGTEQFYSKQNSYSIIVNARPKTVHSSVLTFKELVDLAFETPPDGAGVVITVTYRNGPVSNPEGSLTLGDSVDIQDGMIFNVTATDKS